MMIILVNLVSQNIKAINRLILIKKSIKVTFFNLGDFFEKTVKKTVKIPKCSKNSKIPKM